MSPIGNCHIIHHITIKKTYTKSFTKSSSSLYIYFYMYSPYFKSSSLQSFYRGAEGDVFVLPPVHRYVGGTPLHQRHSASAWLPGVVPHDSPWSIWYVIVLWPYLDIYIYRERETHTRIYIYYIRIYLDIRIALREELEAPEGLPGFFPRVFLVPIG